jgi:peptidoglycan/LPS O-acetylase OafA/YrhL
VAFDIIARFGFFNYWIFAPRFLAHVTFGMALAPHLRRLGWRSGFVGLAVLAVAVAVQEMNLGLRLGLQASWVGAIALTVVLLVVLRPVARVPVLAPVLAWLGRSSYGIYIGQLIVHNAFVYALGLQGLPERVDPWLYTAVLLVGGVGFTWLGESLRRATAALRMRLLNPQRLERDYPPAAVHHSTLPGSSQFSGALNAVRRLVGPKHS